MFSSLGTDTIREAFKQGKAAGGLALHSEQGASYTSQAYFDLAEAYHVSPSISSSGCPSDIAVMEDSFSTLKTECLYCVHYFSRAEVEQLVTALVHFDHLERFSLKNGPAPGEIRGKAGSSTAICNRAFLIYARGSGRAVQTSR